MTKTWRVRLSDLDVSTKLMNSLALSPLAAKVLTNRGIKTKEEGERFLNPSLSHLPAPFAMKGMDRAVHRIIEAIKNQEAILVYGDYDVDGVTSTTLLVAFLRELGIKPKYHIPHRIREGYGLNIDAVRRFTADGISLLITADCGISDHDEILEATRSGIDTIVIDHHEIPDNIPPAVAILNPKQKDCSFPFEKLAGVGVAFQLLIALRAKLREMGFWRTGDAPNLRRYLDLVSLGTISDMVPLVHANRVLVKYGLAELTETSRRGIQALKARAGLEGKIINTGHVAFQLAPRLNASGRLDTATRAVDLLLTDAPDEAAKIAGDLDQLNDTRHGIEDRIFAGVLRQIEDEPETLEQSSLFFSSSGWHPGVIGIVASRLVERFGKPTVLIAINEENLGKGSARGVNGLDLYQALGACQDLLKAYGGHRVAAGFTVRAESIAALQARFEKILSRELSPETGAPCLLVDAEVGLAQIDHRLIRDLIRFEPHGIGNPKPLFLSRDVAVYDRRIVGADSLKLRVQDRGSFEAIGFGLAHRFSHASRSIDLVFTPQLNHWTGSPRIELEMRDLMPHLSEER